MATVSVPTIKPSLRIQIENNLMEPMDVDVTPTSDLEEGQISDEELVEEPRPSQTATKPVFQRVWNNSRSTGFNTGIDIFDKNERDKLNERAQRFGLSPSEITNFTDEDLRALHASLGITAENERNVRFEAIHMRGTDDMSTNDVFEYFVKYGPTTIEWINDESCNVVWLDKVSAARALNFTSRRVKGMPKEGSCNPFKATEESDEPAERTDGRSILLINREIEIDDGEEPDESVVALGEITVPVPPGYWRLGESHPKSKGILMRFAFVTDKKPYKAERFSEYYKKYGNPNYGGLKGLISSSKRMTFKGIFDRNKDMPAVPPPTVPSSKNPWGDIAENWDEDERFAERVVQPPNRREVAETPAKSDVLSRLKRPHEDETVVVSSSNNEDEEVETKTKSKIPRMRMYADEEEEKIKRKKRLLTIKQSVVVQPQPIEIYEDVHDLRKIIGTSTPNRRPAPPPDQPELPNNGHDLAAKLKNRLGSRNGQPEPRMRSDAPQPAKVFERITARRPSPDERRRSRSDRHRPSSPRRRREPPTRRPSDEIVTKEQTVDVDRNKPKSKVAVVIKTQKKPTVASTIWSRVALPQAKERLKTASERQRQRKESSSESEDDESDSSSGSSRRISSSSTGNEGNASSGNSSGSDNEAGAHSSNKAISRPGFDTNSASDSVWKNKHKQKRLLRVEINNERCKEEKKS